MIVSPVLPVHRVSSWMTLLLLISCFNHGASDYLSDAYWHSAYRPVYDWSSVLTPVTVPGYMESVYTGPSQYGNPAYKNNSYGFTDVIQVPYGPGQSEWDWAYVHDDSNKPQYALPPVTAGNKPFLNYDSPTKYYPGSSTPNSYGAPSAWTDHWWNSNTLIPNQNSNTLIVNGANQYSNPTGGYDSVAYAWASGKHLDPFGGYIIYNRGCWQGFPYNCPPSAYSPFSSSWPPSYGNGRC